MGRELTLENISEWVAKCSECKLICAEKRKMSNRFHWYVKLVCPCGEVFERRFNDFKRQNEKRCLKCLNRELHTYEDVKKYIEEDCRDWIKLKLISDKYKSYTNNLTIEDELGFKYFVSYQQIKRNKERKSSFAMFDISNPYSLENIKNYVRINEPKYKVLSDKYADCEEKIEFRCCKEHKFQMKWNSFRQGQRCYECYIYDNRGENHPAWKGGITNISSYLRDYIKEWKDESIKSSNEKCVLTGTTFNDIHHLYGFSLILAEVLQENKIEIKSFVSDYTEEELKLLRKQILKKHFEYPLGVCLCEDLHLIYHKIYGYGGNTPKQFEEFKNNYYNRIFDKDLKEELKSYNSIKRLKLKEVS